MQQDGQVPLRLIDMPSGFNHVDHTGFRRDWWLRPRMDQQIWLSVADDQGTEVARVHLLDLDQTTPGNYIDVVETPDFLKLELIEVHAAHRRQAIGTATLDLLASRYPDRRLYAFSENNDFWQSTGWNRHIHKDFDPNHLLRYPELFIQP